MLSCEQVKGSGEEPGVAVDGSEYVMGPRCATRRICARSARSNLKAPRRSYSLRYGPVSTAFTAVAQA